MYGCLLYTSPVIYRVAHVSHHRTGDTWCIYPMYDFAHPIEDAIEGITHSICTLEFEDHRPLYDWVVRELEYPCLLYTSKSNCKEHHLRQKRGRALLCENECGHSE